MSGDTVEGGREDAVSWVEAVDQRLEMLAGRKETLPGFVVG